MIHSTVAVESQTAYMLTALWICIILRNRHWLASSCMGCSSEKRQTINDILVKIYSMLGTSLVVQWIKICLPMKGRLAQSLAGKIRHATRQLKPVCQSHTLEPLATTREVVASWSHCNEKPVHCNGEQPLLTTTRESPYAAMKTLHSQK